MFLIESKQRRQDLNGSQSVSSPALRGNQTSKPVTNVILKNLLELKSGFRFSSLYIMFLIPDFTSSSFVLGNFFK